MAHGIENLEDVSYFDLCGAGNAAVVRGTFVHVGSGSPTARRRSRSVEPPGTEDLAFERYVATFHYTGTTPTSSPVHSCKTPTGARRSLEKFSMLPASFFDDDEGDAVLRNDDGQEALKSGGDGQYSDSKVSTAASTPTISPVVAPGQCEQSVEPPENASMSVNSRLRAEAPAFVPGQSPAFVPGQSPFPMGIATCFVPAVMVPSQVPCMPCDEEVMMQCHGPVLCATAAPPPCLGAKAPSARVRSPHVPGRDAGQCEAAATMYMPSNPFGNAGPKGHRGDKESSPTSVAPKLTMELLRDNGGKREPRPSPECSSSNGSSTTAPSPEATARCQAEPAEDGEQTAWRLPSRSSKGRGAETSVAKNPKKGITSSNKASMVWRPKSREVAA